MRLRPVTVALAAQAFLALLACAAHAASLADRLPSGVAMIGSVDLAKVRSSALIDQKAWAAAPGPQLLEQAGIRFREDVDELALGVMPQAAPASTQADSAAGSRQDFVVLMSGRFDAAKVKTALLAHGAKQVQLGAATAWRTPSTSLSFSDAMPSLDASQPIFVSFLDGVLVAGSERATKAALGAKTTLPTPALGLARQNVPSTAAFWISADLTSLKPESVPGGVTVPAGLKSLVAWGTFTDAIDLKALAKAGDAQQASQLAALVTLLTGGLGTAPPDKPFSGLKITAEGDTIRATVRLTKEQLASMAASAPEPAQGSGKPL